MIENPMHSLKKNSNFESDINLELDSNFGSDSDFEPDDDFDSIMGVIHVPEESDPVEHGTIICTTFNEGRDGENETKDNIGE